MKRPLISILSIAGSDSCAGAGIQADVKAAASCGIYCTTAITAVTAQSTGGVDKVIPIGPCDVKAQILSVLEDGLPDAIKIGMIGSVKTGLEIVSLLQNQLKEIPVVVDPVLGSTSGKSFASGKESLVDFYKDSLLPLSTIVTPNINEASALLNKNLDITDIKSQTLVAKELLSTLRCRSVVLKGGIHAVSLPPTFLFIEVKTENVISQTMVLLALHAIIFTEQDAPTPHFLPVVLPKV